MISNKSMDAYFYMHYKAQKTLGKFFAEGNYRQKGFDKLYIDNDFFYEYFSSDTRQRLYRFPLVLDKKKVTITTLSNGDGTFT